MDSSTEVSKGLQSVSTVLVHLNSFEGKDGKLMATVRLDDPRPHKIPGYSEAMPLEDARRLAESVAKERGGTLFIDNIRTEVRDYSR
jgi:hypothetical protein